jgi:hypothetical protein
VLEEAVAARVFLGLATAGFIASAVLHLATFVPLAPPAGDAPALLLFGAAFVPLVAMLARLRGAARARAWRRLRVLEWRALVPLVPPGIRVLLFGAVLYALMNLVLSLMATGGVTMTAEGGRAYVVEAGGRRREVSEEEYDAHRRLTTRLLTGHLLLFYLVPLTYFRFIDSRRGELAGTPRGDRP